jgi:hypothetical protein
MALRHCRRKGTGGLAQAKSRGVRPEATVRCRTSSLAMRSWITVHERETRSAASPQPACLGGIGARLPVPLSRRCLTSRIKNSASSPRPSSIARAAALTISASLRDPTGSKGRPPDAKERESTLKDRASPEDSAKFLRSSRIRVPSTPPHTARGLLAWPSRVQHRNRGGRSRLFQV